MSQIWRIGAVDLSQLFERHGHGEILTHKTPVLFVILICAGVARGHGHVFTDLSSFPSPPSLDFLFGFVFPVVVGM